MLTLDFQPYDAATLTFTPRILTSGIVTEFDQRAPDGINNNLEVWNITADKKPGVDIETLYTFLHNHRGTMAFEWTPPGALAPKRYICRQMDRTLDHYNVVQSLTATLEEVPL